MKKFQLQYIPNKIKIITIMRDDDKTMWSVNRTKDEKSEKLYKSLLETIFYLKYYKTEMTMDELFEFVGVEIVSDTFGGESINDEIYKWKDVLNYTSNKHE